MLTGEFIEGGAGKILVVSHNPEHATDHAVVVVPAFAEEMNKSRRLVWETGQMLSRRGVRTIVPDLYGTGDSQGNFVDASWSTWQEDLRLTVEWAKSGGAARLSVLVVRMGAALFAGSVGSLGTRIERVVAWQPVRQGQDVLKYMLRMKSLALRMAGAPSQSVDEMHQKLLAGPDPLELGGYMLSGELAAAMGGAGFSEAELTSVGAGLTIDLTPAPMAKEMAAPGEEDAGSSGWATRRLSGERFWMVVEPGPNPGMVDETVAFLTAA